MACSFVGFYCSCFPSILDFLLQTLKFLSRFFWLVGTSNEHNFTSKLTKHLLNTLYKFKKHLGILNSDDFVKSVQIEKFCMTTRTVTRIVSGGKCQLGVTLFPGLGTPIGQEEVSQHSK